MISIIADILQRHKKNFFALHESYAIIVCGEEQMDRKNIDKIAQNAEDRVLLAKLWDKINAGIRKNIPAHTGFLSPRELQLAQYLFGDEPGLHRFGGYEDSERKMYIYLPDYLDESSLMDEDSPVVCLRASFFKDETPTHRDFLGALMGSGITRESVGDILVGDNTCDFFVTTEIAPYIIQNFENAGRVSLKITPIALPDVSLPEQKFSELKDTVASVRLDSIISSGFRISRGTAGENIAAGKAAIDGLICEKADKSVPEGAKISVRGLGKIKLSQIGHTTKKGRISVTIHRYE